MDPSHQSSHIESLLKEHAPFLRRLAAALVSQPDVAEDVVHETWLAALRTPQMSLGNPRAWLASVLRKKVVSRARRDGTRTTLALEGGAELEASGAVDPSDIALQLERERMVLNAIESLKEPYRTAIFLRYRESLGAAAIAERLGVPIKTVRTRLHRGLHMLRTSLDADGGGRSEWMAALLPLANGFGSAPLTITKTAATAATSLTMKKIFVAAAAALALLFTGWVVVGGGGRRVSPDTESAGESGLMRPRAEIVKAVRAEATDALEASGTRRDEESTKANGAPTLEGEEPVRALDIQVVNEAGLPIAGRTILVDAFRSTGSVFMPRRAPSDESGQIHLEGLPLGFFSVVDVLGCGRASIDMAAQESAFVKLEIAGAVALKGRVVGANGAAAPNARIWGMALHGADKSCVELTTAGADGRFELACSKRLIVHASAAGRIPSRAQEIEDLEEVRPGHFVVKLMLQGPGTALSGLVVDEFGEPVAGARVVAGGGKPRQWSELPGDPARPVHVPCDEDGRFDYPWTLPRGTERLAAYAEGYAPAHMTVECTGVSQDLEIVLRRGATVRGTIARADGGPAEGATIEPLPAGSDYDTEGYGRIVNVRSDAEGRFTLRNIPLGSLTLRAQSPAKTPLERSLSRLEVLEPGTYEVALQLNDQPLIAGYVLDRDGNPAPGVSVSARSEPTGARDTRIWTTRADGSFRLTSLYPRNPDQHKHWKILVMPAGAYFGKTIGEVTKVAAGDQNVVIEIDVPPALPSAFIVGTVTCAEGRLPDSLRVSLLEVGARGAGFIAVDKNSGAFRHGPIAAGTYSIQAYLKNELVVSKSGLTILEGETIDVGSLALGAGGQVRVTLDIAAAPALREGLERRGLDEIWLRIESELGREGSLEYTGDCWESSGVLEAGRWWVAAQSRNLLMTERTEFAVVVGVTTEVAVKARMGREIDLRLTLPSAESWSSMTIHVRQVDGDFEIELPPIERSSLNKPTFAGQEVVVPVGTFDVVIETDSEVGSTTRVNVPEHSTPYRKVPITVE